MRSPIEHYCYARPLRFETLEDRRLLSVTGNYNSNFAVDAADYVLWRKSVGTTGAHPADGNGDIKPTNVLAAEYDKRAVLVVAILDFSDRKTRCGRIEASGAEIEVEVESEPTCFLAPNTAA